VSEYDALGTTGMTLIVSRGSGRAAAETLLTIPTTFARGGSRSAPGRADTRPGGFARSSPGNTRGGDDDMFFLVMLVPFGLLGLMLGMERLERWTSQEQKES